MEKDSNTYDNLSLKNTLGGQIGLFRPILEGFASLYHCGPTVYGPAHIGNLRSYVFADILRRTLEFSGLKVKQVINITDVGHLTSDADSGDDKMTKALREKGLEINLENMKKVGQEYAEIFLKDLSLLNVLPPDETPFASDNIKEDLEIIEKLEENGLVYKISDGLYFDTGEFEKKYPGEYGRLGNIDIEKLRAGARVAENSEKKSFTDFALWKFNDDLGYESKYGKGFPGWHLECSAMSRKFLGQPFDIHTGGIDHIGTHHNNEIAQSKGAYGTDLANYWMHNAHITMNGKKISKSAGNFLTLKDLAGLGIHPLAYRFWLLQGHYSRPMDFSIEAVRGAQNRLNSIVADLTNSDISFQDYEQKEPSENILKMMQNDLDTPGMIASFDELLLGGVADKVLGLNLEFLTAEYRKILEAESNNSELNDLVKKQQVLRDEKKYDEADEIRTQIEKLTEYRKDFLGFLAKQIKF